MKRFVFILFALSFVGFLIFGVKKRKGSNISPQVRYWIALTAFITLLILLLQML